MKVSRVERHIIKRNHPYYQLLDQFCFKSKNLYNFANYHIRQTFILDSELPIKRFYNKSRRKHRGLFISNKNIPINADVNGSYQILKKVFPNVFADGIEGVGLHPVIVNI